MGRRKIKNGNVKYPSARVHHMTLWVYDREGNLITPESKIKEVLSKHTGGFLTYAYILHDADQYSAEDVYEREEKNRVCSNNRYSVLADVADLASDPSSPTGFVEDEGLRSKAQAYADEIFPKITEGDIKPHHWHLVFTFGVNRKIDEIARWFGIDPNWNEAKIGRSAAPNAWMYLVHANDKNKHPYVAEDVRSSFDYVSDLQEMLDKNRRHEQYASADAFEINDILTEVGERGMTINEVKQRIGSAVYYRNQTLFEKARKDYVLNHAPMPLFREVFYVESEGIDEDHGRGGLGKSVCAKALARSLAKEFGADTTKDVNDLQSYIYIAGDAKVFLQEYDGQPILMIDEISGVDMKRALKGVNGVKSLLAPFPERKAYDKKHGSVVCTSKYIVINGIQSLRKFIRELAGEAVVDGVKQESELSVEEQFWRRIWAQIKIINSSELEFWANRGLFENAGDRTLLEMIGRVRVNFKELASRTTGEAQCYLEGKILEPVLLEVEKSQTAHAVEEKISDINALPEDLLVMGEVIDTEAVVQDSFFEELSDEEAEALPF